MIVPHRFIDELTEAQVFTILRMLGEWTKNNRKGGFFGLPRYPIDFTGAPANINVARLLLHAAAEDYSTLTVTFRCYLQNEQGNLRKEKETNPNIEADTRDWTLHAASILIYLHNKLSIEFKNQAWQAYCSSEQMIGISEIRDLLKAINMDVSKLNNQLIIMPNANVGEIVIGQKNVYNSVIEKKGTINFSNESIKNLINKGDTKGAIDTLIDVCAEDKDKSIKAILLKSRYQDNQKDYHSGTRTPEDYRAENQKINEAVLNFFDLY